MRVLNCPKCGNNYGIPFWKKKNKYYLHCYHCNYNGSKKKTMKEALLYWNNKKSNYERKDVNYLDYDKNKIVNWNIK